jgi:hypothetical protein
MLTRDRRSPGRQIVEQINSPYNIAEPANDHLAATRGFRSEQGQSLLRAQPNR